MTVLRSYCNYNVNVRSVGYVEQEAQLMLIAVRLDPPCSDEFKTMHLPELMLQEHMYI